MKSLIQEIRNKQDEIIVMVNSTFDEIIKKVSQFDSTDIKLDNEYEVIYPLTNTSGFKGKKIIAVYINDERKLAFTWKSAVETILNEVIEDKTNDKKLHVLCDKLLGRKRTRLSKDSTGMRSPIKLNNGLYVETHYDTETLMNLLLQILYELSYDYSNIRIAIKN